MIKKFLQEVGHYGSSSLHRRRNVTSMPKVPNVTRSNYLNLSKPRLYNAFVSATIYIYIYTSTYVYILIALIICVCLLNFVTFFLLCSIFVRFCPCVSMCISYHQIIRYCKMRYTCNQLRINLIISFVVRIIYVQ